MAPVDAMINSLSKKDSIQAIEGPKVLDDLCSYERPKEATRGDGDDDDGDYECALAA